MTQEPDRCWVCGDAFAPHGLAVRQPSGPLLRFCLRNDAGEIVAELCADCAAEVQFVAEDFVQACALAAGEEGREVAMKRVAETIAEMVAEIQAEADKAGEIAAVRQAP